MSNSESQQVEQPVEASPNVPTNPSQAGLAPPTTTKKPPSSPTAPPPSQQFAPLFGSQSDGMSMWGQGVFTTTLVPSLDDQLTETNFNQSAFSGGLITTYTLDTEYQYDEHVLQMPVACTTTQACTFANVGNETLMRVVNWSAEKIDEPPMMPDPDTNNTNETLLSKSFSPMNVELAPGGVQFIYTIRGTYTYGITNSSTAQMYFGVVPYLNQSYDESYLGNFQHGLIDPDDAA